MNDQNQNYNFKETDRYQGNTYEYVFSMGKQQLPVSPSSKKGKGAGRRVGLVLLTLVLCVSFSFAAGFGGAWLVYTLKEDQRQPMTEDDINKAPEQEDVYNETPQDVLDKNVATTSPYGSAGEDVFSVSQVVKMVEDTVVVIDVTVKTGNSFFGTQTGTGSGSGVVISADGYILTCHHVIEDATEIKVTLNSGKKYEATLVGSDADSDLAVIKIEPTEKLTYAEQGCSADLLVGEQVVAIGNPLGKLGGTVTDGIISATERNVQVSDGLTMTLLQTNAAINSGNSGGGLFNLDGKLIGVVNAKYAAEGVEGLAFAIPIDHAYEVQLDLIQYGYVRGIVDDGLEVLDVNFDNLNWYQQEQYKRDYGIYCSGVYVLSSAYCQDLENADRIISINGTQVNSVSEFNSLVSKYQVGDVLTILASRDNVEFTTELTLCEYVPDYTKDENS